MGFLEELIEREIKKAAKNSAIFLKEVLRIGKEALDIFIEEFSKDTLREIAGKKKKEEKEEEKS
jgi:hypothetical protein